MLDGDSLSSILGWVSIASWVIVYSPQIVTNFRLKSGDGLSVGFVVVWLLGDLCNLVGACLAGLLPTVIILAVYYTACDLILLFQIYFYRWKKQGRSFITPASESSNDRPEETPLLDVHHELEQKSSTKFLLQYTAALLFVFATGLGAWWITKDNEKTPSHPKQGTQWIIQIIGWSSALLYLGARIPQISKNFKTRCEGLSPALFLFAILGNTTYALSICAASMDREYLITNGSWLAGSSLTVFLDLIVLGQFFYYRSVDRHANANWIA